MTYLTERILQRTILRSPFYRLAFISLMLLALHATPASAQWTTNGGNTTINDNVGIGTTGPGAKLEINGAIDVNNANLKLRSTNNDASGLTMWAKSSGAQTNSRNWQIVSNYFVAGNLDIVRSTSNSGNPTTAVMSIDKSGNVGLGTFAPSASYKLDVNGGINASGNINATGDIIATGVIRARYQDLAEWVPASEHIPAGTVVVLDATKSNHVISSTRGYDTRVAGVISAQPGIALGESGENKVLVATTGRVRVKVDASHGPIQVGDLLVTSDVPGLAMKSEPIKVSGRLMHMPGTLIGKALEPLEKGSGTILVLLSLQ